ncbi:hypothetical protein LTR86_003920 [Recurvomyces mirabilis]|nr:hypothetical protein LTR86_003920 [Recurvomyces mirabilis]
MGKAYSPSQREHVRSLLESGRDEEAIEKETGVSDRTIRRWKVELERTGRIGKPPESRTGRHRVLTPEVEAALFEHVRGNPELSVDDMLWWLYDRYSIVVGTRTIRRVFERKGDKVRGKGRKGGLDHGPEEEDEEEEEEEEEPSLPPAPRGRQGQQYQSPYAPMMPGNQLQQAPQAPPKRTPVPTKTAPPPPPPPVDIEDDEEMMQLELQQIALQKREVELKLKMRRIQAAKGSPAASTSRKSAAAAATTPLSAPPSTPSTLFNPRTAVAAPTPPKRDSRSKKKIQESKLRTAERQERMLRELERRSRRRDHLTAEWVTSKDIWPLRAQGLLANLMHQYGCYAYSPSNEQVFGQMYHDLYDLVDLTKGDWSPEIHDDQLRDRMKRKMGQLRTKMLKTGEIVSVSVGRGGSTGDGFTSGSGTTAFQRVENFTGQAAGEDDEEGGGEEADVDLGAQQHQQQQDLDDEQQQLSQNQQGLDQHDHQHLQYELPPEHAGMHGQAQHLGGPYGNGMMHQHGQYPMMPQGHHAQMMPYGMDGQHGGQNGMGL